MSDLARLIKAGDKRQRTSSPEVKHAPSFSSAPPLGGTSCGSTHAAMNSIFMHSKGGGSGEGSFAHYAHHVSSQGHQQATNVTGRMKVTQSIPSILPVLPDTGYAGSPVLSGIRTRSQANLLTLPLPSLPAIKSGTDLPSLDAYMHGSGGLPGSGPAAGSSGLSLSNSGPMGVAAVDLQSLFLPEPTGLSLTASTTTSLHIRWNPVEGLDKWSHNLYWAIEFCRADDTEVLGECTFPLMLGEAPVTGLGPGVDYKIRLRLQFFQTGVAAAIRTSSWTTAVFATMDVAAEPDTPPRPVVHRISSITAEVTILAAPCMKGNKYHCAESYLLQRLEGVIPDDNSRDDEWKSVPEVTCACSHPKFPEIVPSLEKKRVPLCGDKTYHFRVRSINSHDHSEWSEICTILPPPASTEVRVEQVKSLSATLVWNVPEDHGYEICHYHVFISKLDDETGESTKEAVVPAVAHTHKMEEEDGKDRDQEGSPGPAVVYYHPQQLQPNCSYKLHVQAKSEAGMSDPSTEVTFVTQPMPPPLPASVGVDKIEPDALDFTWSLRDENSSNVTAVCEVAWREVLQEELEVVGGSTAKLARTMEVEERSEKWSAKDIPCAEEMGGDYTCHIIGLRPDNLYAIMVRGRNGGGDGPWSPVVVQRTTVPPPQMPTTFYSSDTTSTSTTLSWGQPFDDAYPVTAYQIRVQDVSEGEDDGPWQSITEVETGDEKERLCYVVEDLEPGKEYAFQVRALNQNGPGEATEALKVCVKCDVPPPPAQPESSEQTSESICLNWRPPARDNGSEVTSYYLQMHQDGEEEWTTVSEEITSTSVEVSCSDPRTVYHFRVRAWNALGYSEWSDESMFETLPPPPPEPPTALSVLATHNSVTINWPHHQWSITGYEVQQQRHGEWTAVVEAEHLINDQLRRFKRERKHMDSDLEETSRLRKRPVLAFTRENLAGKTEYKFRVAAKNPGGQAFSPHVSVTTEDEQWARKLSAEEDQRLLDLCQLCGCEEYFERLSRALYDAETLSRLHADELRDVLDKLQVLPKHREKLRASLSEPPGAPQKLHVVRCDVNFDVLLCSWESPEICGGSYPVIEYVIQYENRSLVTSVTSAPDDEEGHEWVEVRCGTTTCKLDNLVSSTEYAVRVAACNEPQGQGPWSQEVCVRTADAECGDEELNDALRAVLNTKEYADKVAAQLYHEQWTLASLQAISPGRLEEVLRHMRVKEGAVHALLQYMSSSPKKGDDDDGKS